MSPVRGRQTLSSYSLHIRNATRCVPPTNSRHSAGQNASEMMQWLADHLDELRSHGGVIKLPGKKTTAARKIGA